FGISPCAIHIGGSCEQCLMNVSCLWCYSNNTCVDYPMRTLLPSTNICPPSGVFAGVIVCCYCCDEEIMAKRREERKQRAEEKKAKDLRWYPEGCRFESLSLPKRDPTLLGP
uniref:Uncharacterized protein n=1 Tax=Erpetoichthys calabaricus TaxID=27687 RepID=A0A8C4XG08_ERPCA